jgi:hypothetical protein
MGGAASVGAGRGHAWTGLLAGATLLVACARPGWEPGAPGPFDVVVPQGWAVVRNTRALGNRELVLRSRDGRATFALAWVRLDARARALPLDLLAETRALEQGRSVGFVNVIDDLRWIVLDERPAVAVTGRSTWRPVSEPVASAAQEGTFSLVVVRSDERLALLLLSAPSGELDAYTGDLAVLLDGFRLLQTPRPEHIPLPDAEPGTE